MMYYLTWGGIILGSIAVIGLVIKGVLVFIKRRKAAQAALNRLIGTQTVTGANTNTGTNPSPNTNNSGNTNNTTGTSGNGNGNANTNANTNTNTTQPAPATDDTDDSVGFWWGLLLAPLKLLRSLFWGLVEFGKRSRYILVVGGSLIPLYLLFLVLFSLDSPDSLPSEGISKFLYTVLTIWALLALVASRWMVSSLVGFFIPISGLDPETKHGRALDAMATEPLLKPLPGIVLLLVLLLGWLAWGSLDAYTEHLSGLVSRGAVSDITESDIYWYYFTYFGGLCFAVAALIIWVFYRMLDWRSK